MMPTDLEIHFEELVGSCILIPTKIIFFIFVGTADAYSSFQIPTKSVFSIFVGISDA